MKNTSHNLARAFTIVLILLQLTAMVVAPKTAHAATLNHDYPRLANYFLKWGISRAEAIELAKWDVVIVDMEAQTYLPENLKLLRQLNPNIIILAYITAQEIRTDAGTLDHQTLRYK